MALPLLQSPPVTTNARVQGLTVPSDESPRQSAAAVGGSASGADRAEVKAQIEQAYRQIFFHAFKFDRDSLLESQLLNGQISTRDFIRGLLLSRKFREGFQNCNNNYRLAEQVVSRVLGRPIYGEQERIALSIVIAQRGLPALVDELLDSGEYLDAFGYDNVPYQRSRILPGQSLGVMPFNQQAPRYDAYWRDIMAKRAPIAVSDLWGGVPRPAWLEGQPTPRVRKIWQYIVTAGGFGVTALLIWVVASILSTS